MRTPDNFAPVVLCFSSFREHSEVLDRFQQRVLRACISTNVVPLTSVFNESDDVCVSVTKCHVLVHYTSASRYEDFAGCGGTASLSQNWVVHGLESVSRLCSATRPNKSPCGVAQGFVLSEGQCREEEVGVLSVEEKSAGPSKVRDMTCAREDDCFKTTHKNANRSP